MLLAFLIAAVAPPANLGLFVLPTNVSILFSWARDSELYNANAFSSGIASIVSSVPPSAISVGLCLPAIVGATWNVASIVAVFVVVSTPEAGPVQLLRVWSLAPDLSTRHASLTVNPAAFYPTLHRAGMEPVINSLGGAAAEAFSILGQRIPLAFAEAPAHSTAPTPPPQAISVTVSGHGEHEGSSAAVAKAAQAYAVFLFFLLDEDARLEILPLNTSLEEMKMRAWTYIDKSRQGLQVVKDQKLFAQFLQGKFPQLVPDNLKVSKEVSLSSFTNWGVDITSTSLLAQAVGNLIGLLEDLLPDGPHKVEVLVLWRLLSANLLEDSLSPECWNKYSFGFIAQVVTDLLFNMFARTPYVQPKFDNVDDLVVYLRAAYDDATGSMQVRSLLFDRDHKPKAPVADKPQKDPKRPGLPSGASTQGNPKKPRPGSGASGAGAGSSSAGGAASTSTSSCMAELLHWLDPSNPVCNHGSSCKFDHANFATTHTKASAKAFITRLRGGDKTKLAVYLSLVDNCTSLV